MWVVVAGDLTPLGGMDAANLALAKHLATLAPVHVVTHRASRDLSDTPAVAVHRVRRPLDSHVLGEPLLDRAGCRWARRLSPCRVVVNGGNCKWSDVTWMHYVHAAYQCPSTGLSPRGIKARLVQSIDRRRERRRVPECRWVICNSRRTARDVVDRLGVRPERVRVVYYGTDPTALARVTPARRRAAKASFGWPPDRPVVAFVGALGDRRKGFDTLFDAWTTLCGDARWDAELVVVGSGRELAAWTERSRRCGLATRIRFLGFRTDVPDVLAACDSLVHPARYEAFGLGVQEALCRGLPAIVSADAGIAELFPPRLASLLLASPDDSAAVARGLWEWRRHKEQLDEAVAPFAERLLSRSWADMAAEFVRAVSEPPPRD